MAHIVIINPRFDTSYWGLEHALPLFDAKANLPVACLPLLAALTPAGAHDHPRSMRMSSRSTSICASRLTSLASRHDRAALPDEGDFGPS